MIKPLDTPLHNSLADLIINTERVFLKWHLSESVFKNVVLTAYTVSFTLFFTPLLTRSQLQVNDVLTSSPLH